MGEKTEESQAMTEIVAAHAPALKEAGFRKRRHGFNRAAEDGLIHMVHFWMAPKEPPAWNEVPGLRERRYGSFRIDFGVHVPQMQRLGTPRGQWINTADCQLHETVGRLLTGEWNDFWWRLDDPDATRAAGAALDEVGLPWLDQFPDAAAVLDAFDQQGAIGIGLNPAGALEIADLCRARQDTSRERRVLEAYVGEPVLQSHVEVLQWYLERHGHDDLVARITTRPSRE
jgi:hypothetical protein